MGFRKARITDAESRRWQVILKQSGAYRRAQDFLKNGNAETFRDLLKIALDRAFGKVIDRQEHTGANGGNIVVQHVNFGSYCKDKPTV